MIQQQIVDYAKSQLALGVDHEAIKSALIETGWTKAEVDESLDAAAGITKPKAQKPEAKQSETRVVFEPIKGFIKKEDGLKEPTIIVSDLTASPKPSINILAKQKDAVEKKQQGKTGEKTMATPITANSSGRLFGIDRSLIFTTTLEILVIGFAASTVIFYLNTVSLNKEVGKLRSAAGAVNSQTEELNHKIDGLQTEVNSLRSENKLLTTELSFFAAPPTTSAMDIFTLSDLKGMLSGGEKNPYVLTTGLGSKISIKNFKDGAVNNVLKPLVGQEISISGTYSPGSGMATINAVNGNAIGVAGE